MDIQELHKKIKKINALRTRRDQCAEEWEEWIYKHERSCEDVHYCKDTCPIGKICEDANFGICEAVHEVLNVFENEQ